MGLETGTYIGDLNTSNPVTSDATSQGDDHIRLLKSVLQNTFPNADKAFRFPDAVAKTASYTVLSTDLQKLITGDATSAQVDLTLPTLASTDDGWAVWVIKIDSSANAVRLVGTINGASNLSLSTQYQMVKVIWSGSAWYALTLPLGALGIASGAALTAPASDDSLPIYDLSATSNKKIALSDLFKILNGFTTETAPALTDTLAIYDLSATAVRTMTLQNLMSVVPVSTRQIFTSGSGTYTTPSGVRQLRIRMVGGGGGGGARNTNNGAAGTDTTFNSIVAESGLGGYAGDDAGGVGWGGYGGTGGAGSASLRVTGGDGHSASSVPAAGTGAGGNGGASAFGGGGAGGPRTNGAGSDARAYGAGGGGGSGVSAPAGGGGGAGEYVEILINSPSASYSYQVGTGGAGGAAGTYAGGAGKSGVIIVDELY